MYEIGDRIGPNQLELLQITKITTYGHRYGLFKCNCGENFEAKLYHIANGSTQKCKKCRSKAKQGKNSNHFKDLTGNKYGKLTVIKYIGSIQVGETKGKILTRSLWELKCECGNVIQRTTNELERNNIHSCPNCKITSIGEEKIKEILTNLNIEFICQYTFKDCKDKKLLPFDFYLPKENILFEYDGLGHYKANEYGGWRTENSVKTTQYHDKIKNDYCKNHNIKLIRIPYYDYDKLNKEYIMSKIYS